VSHLYGSGRHWFAPGQDLGDEDIPAGQAWLQHSIVLLHSMLPLAVQVADLLVGGGTAADIETAVLTVHGCDAYISKFVQGPLPFMRELVWTEVSWALAMPPSSILYFRFRLFRPMFNHVEIGSGILCIEGVGCDVSLELFCLCLFAV
jgi:hypothetical protein